MKVFYMVRCEHDERNADFMPPPPLAFDLLPGGGERSPGMDTTEQPTE